MKDLLDSFIIVALCVIAGIIGALVASLIPRQYVKTVVVERQTVKEVQAANQFYKNYQDCVYRTTGENSAEICLRVARESVK